jgi:Ca2+-binding EF-hand superfamily protein
MGGLCSKAAQAHQHWTLIDDVSAVVKNLKLTREEVEKFYKVFKEIDEAGYGRITPEQLINFVGYDSTNRLRMKMLQLMEPDQSLDGFIIVLWHICTMKPRDLGKNETLC